MKIVLLACLCACLLFFGMWIFAVPEDLIKARMDSRLAGLGLQADVQDLRKGLFYDFEARRITLQKSGRPLVLVEDLQGRLDPFSVLLGRATLSMRGMVGGGTMEGRMDLFQKGSQAYLRVENAHLQEIPLAETLGLNGKGILSGRLDWKGDTGDLRFSIQDARWENRAISGLLLPWKWFHEMEASLVLGADSLHITSLSLTGSGIYARIRGEIVEGKMDLMVELMPDRSFVSKKEALIFTAIDRYRVSPGHYRIPIRSTVSF